MYSPVSVIVFLFLVTALLTRGVESGSVDCGVRAGWPTGPTSYLLEARCVTLSNTSF